MHPNTEEEWAILRDFVDNTNLIPYLLERLEPNSFKFDNDIELYVKCCPIDIGEYCILNEELDAYEKDPNY